MESWFLPSTLRYCHKRTLRQSQKEAFCQEGLQSEQKMRPPLLAPVFTKTILVGEVQPYLGSPDGFHGLIHILMCERIPNDRFSPVTSGRGNPANPDSLLFM